MRLTIERLRTLVLVAGGLLILALVVFLAIDKFKSQFSRRDLPRRLGVDIQQEASGFTYTQSRGGHTLFRIHASRVVQLKQGNALLHEVQIELYGPDGSRVDRIEGHEFEYDQRAGLAKATGPVEITLTRPGAARAIAPEVNVGEALGEKAKNEKLSAAARKAARGEVHVQTSGLVFDQHTGVASTNERVEFALVQGAGSAVGARYDSEQGELVLQREVQLELHREGDTVRLRASHAEFDRGDQLCRLSDAEASYRGGTAQMTEAAILFRDDGSAARLDAEKGILLSTEQGSRIAAPKGSMMFDQQNQPSRGRLEGGVTMDAIRNGRKVHGTAQTMTMEFAGGGVLRQAHLERGVQIVSDEQSRTGVEPTRMRESWVSPIADLEFRDAGHGRVELATIHGTGGVVVTGESRQGRGQSAPARLAADEVTGTFGPDSTLTAMTGQGHASIEETTATGVRQTTSGDRLEAHFATGQAGARKGTVQAGSMGGMQIAAATVEGNVVLVQQTQAKPGAAAEPPLQATAQRAVYEGAGEKLHLTGSPRVVNAGLQLTADTIDVAQASGDAVARGNVKATWLQDESGAARPGAMALGGQGAAHAVAMEAQLHQATGEAIFRGHARLWQMVNSITAPVIVLNRTQQTLVARGASAADPVRVVLQNASEKAVKSGTASVIQVRGGDLTYSAEERKAVIVGGVAGRVVSESEDGTTSSDRLELVLLPPGSHAGNGGAAAGVERMTAKGHVVLTSGERKGTGEELVCRNATGECRLTGRPDAPPSISDSVRGSVTGEALIFNTHDDSVSIEGGSRKTTTVTTSPR